MQAQLKLQQQQNIKLTQINLAFTVFALWRRWLDKMNRAINKPLGQDVGAICRKRSYLVGRLYALFMFTLCPYSKWR